MSKKTMADECRPLLEQKCSACHFVTHICPKLKKKKGAWAWKRTFKSMIDNGAVLSNEEVKALVGCLKNPDENVQNICNP